MSERVSVSMNGGMIRVGGHLRTSPPSLDSLIRKGRDWEDEQEFRFIVTLGRADEVRPSVRKGEEIHLLRFPPATIKDLVVGARVSDADAEALRRKVAMSPEWAHLRLLRARLSEQEFELVFDEL